jgi:hypothetical protein
MPIITYKNLAGKRMIILPVFLGLTLNTHTTLVGLRRTIRGFFWCRTKGRTLDLIKGTMPPSPLGYAPNCANHLYSREYANSTHEV